MIPGASFHTEIFDYRLNKVQAMRRFDVLRFLTLLLVFSMILFAGCNLIGHEKNKKGKVIKPIERNLPLAEYASPGGSSRFPLIVDGFGLVYGLGENGGVEVDSAHRQLVRDELNRSGVKNINQLIDSKDTAIVRVQGKIPPGTRKGEPFDVSVTLPSGSECKSLKGGILYHTVLTLMYDAGGDFRRGKTLAVAEGPLLLDPNADKNSPTFEKSAVILGKAIYQDNRDFTLILDDEHHNEKQLYYIATEMERQINRRFKIEGEPTGVAKSRSQPSVRVDVQMHPNYREAPNRYLAILLSIRCFESEAQLTERMAKLKEELLDPETSLYAALQLEALPARTGADTLYEGLKSSNQDVKFYSAEALAYLRKPNVGAILAQIARENPKRRQAAIAALASMGSDLEAAENLIPLMAEGDSDLRYGAFWALWRRTPDHPAIRAWPQEQFPYHYHVLPFNEPLVHVTQSRRQEIVLFSQNIKLNAPFVGNAGTSIVVNVLSPEQVEIIRVRPGRINETRLRPNSLDKVLEAIAELGGSYQDTIQFLHEAATEHQGAYRALTCQLVVDGIAQDAERSYNSAIYAENESEEKTPAAKEAETESKLGKLNPTTWFR